MLTRRPMSPGPESDAGQPAITRNARLFILFRVFFNCRFYYPVYAVLFFDFGLTIQEFAIMNAAWAVTIGLLEIPSGALADQIGRKRLVVFASILMVTEMALLLVTPVGGGAIVFWLLMTNRIVSGAAEASASGADEALAYDSFDESDRSSAWPRVMRRLMIFMSIGFTLSMLAGAKMYSADWLNGFLALFGTGANISPATAMKVPIFANLITGVAALVVSSRMTEVAHSDRPVPGSPDAGTVGKSFAATLRSANWIVRTPAALTILLLAVGTTSFVLLFYCLQSQIYRGLGIPDADFGYIGATISLLGILMAIACERMVKGWTPSQNFGFVGAIVLLGGIALANPVAGWLGVACLLPILFSMRFIQYFVSHYLNLITDSAQRATVLSFRGLSVNFAFGILFLLFSLLTTQIEARGIGTDEAFDIAISWFPWVFAASSVAIYTFSRLRNRRSLTQLIAGHQK